MKTITLTLALLFTLGVKAQEDTLNISMYSASWTEPINKALLEIDRNLYTEYYDFTGKQIPKTYNTPIISYYRGVRKKIILFN